MPGNSLIIKKRVMWRVKMVYVLKLDANLKYLSKNPSFKYFVLLNRMGMENMSLFGNFFFYGISYWMPVGNF